MKTHFLTLLKSLMLSILLPLLVAAFPVIYVYGLNLADLDMINLRLPLGSALIASGTAFVLFLLIQRRPVTASISAAVFAALFHGYGWIYRWLVQPDKFTVEHFMLLPVALALLFYLGLVISKLRPEPARGLQTILLVIAAALVVYNVTVIAGKEVAESAAARAVSAAPPVDIPSQNPTDEANPAAVKQSENGRQYPDIYYIVFDEYAGFSVLRDYFKDNSVDDFEQWLKDNDFYLAANSRSSTLSTIVELSSRMDLQRYNEDTDDKLMVEALRQNEVMRVLKEYGYTTVAIDMAFQSIQADHSLNFDANQMGGMAVDEFQRKFIRDTMLLPFERMFLDTIPSAEKQRDIIFESLEMTTGLEQIDGPKFVYTHILLPHMPFIFDANGELLHPDYREDWNYYLGQYQYSTKVAQELLTELLAEADPDNPPVIIFQSDHGARNISARTRDKDRLFLNRRLEDYSLGKYAYNIVNALYLPGFDTSQLTQDMEPVKTFEIVLNHYLDAGVQVGN